MKKYLFSFAVLAMAMSLLTACGNDEEDTPSRHNDDEAVIPSKHPVDVSDGMFLVGSGNKKAGIDGNVSYIDYTHGWSVQDIFRQANAKSVGKTANYITAYGSKLYIVVDAEATVYDGKIYLTCYGKSYDGDNGIVAAIDTVNFAKQQTYTVGSYPNGVALCGGYLFVTNSDYGMGAKPSLSKIDLKSGVVTEIKNEAITNPMEILTVDNAVYFLDYGTYDANWNQTGAGVRKVTLDGTVTKVVDGTAMCTDGKKIYTVNAPYGAGAITYPFYDIATGETTTWEPADIFSPAVIAADPVTGNIFIVSYQKNPDTGYAGYALPSYTNQYNAQGKLVKKYENTATGPISVVFNTGVKYE